MDMRVLGTADEPDNTPDTPPPPPPPIERDAGGDTP